MKHMAQKTGLASGEKAAFGATGWPVSPDSAGQKEK